jgi:hypothetical protein
MTIAACTLKGIFSVILKLCVRGQDIVKLSLQCLLKLLVEGRVDTVAACTDVIGLLGVGGLVIFYIRVVIGFVFEDILELKVVQLHERQDGIAAHVILVTALALFLHDA